VLNSTGEPILDALTVASNLGDDVFKIVVVQLENIVVLRCEGLDLFLCRCELALELIDCGFFCLRLV
jgi:hypothetical protein